MVPCRDKVAILKVFAFAAWYLSHERLVLRLSDHTPPIPNVPKLSSCISWVIWAMRTIVRVDHCLIPQVCDCRIMPSCAAADLSDVRQ